MFHVTLPRTFFFILCPHSVSLRMLSACASYISLVGCISSCWQALGIHIPTSVHRGRQHGKAVRGAVRCPAGKTTQTVVQANRKSLLDGDYTVYLRAQCSLEPFLGWANLDTKVILWVDTAVSKNN